MQQEKDTLNTVRNVESEISKIQQAHRFRWKAICRKKGLFQSLEIEDNRLKELKGLVAAALLDSKNIRTAKINMNNRNDGIEKHNIVLLQVKNELQSARQRFFDQVFSQTENKSLKQSITQSRGI